MPHLFHSPVDGHVGSFHVLAIVNNAAMNIGSMYLFKLRFFSGYIPRSGIAVLNGGFIFSF